MYMNLFNKKTDKIDTPHDFPEIKKEKTLEQELYSELTKKFINDYNTDYDFENIQYRKGAAITTSFGIAVGYKEENGKLIENGIRFHAGVDRAGGGKYTFNSGKVIDDVVICPFNFNRTRFNNYGDKSYGTLIQLFNDEYGFEMRIAHMDPNKDFIPWSLTQFKRGNKFDQNWIIGQAGTYGFSTGAHTHTEFKSISKDVPIFEYILHEKFNSAIFKDYTDEQVIEKYAEKGISVSDPNKVLENWQEIKREKRLIIANDYLSRYIDWDGKEKTRYSSEKLFKGL